jgi:hypothetical protein
MEALGRSRRECGPENLVPLNDLVVGLHKRFQGLGLELRGEEYAMGNPGAARQLDIAPRIARIHALKSDKRAIEIHRDESRRSESALVFGPSLSVSSPTIAGLLGAKRKPTADERSR